MALHKGSYDYNHYKNWVKMLMLDIKKIFFVDQHIYKFEHIYSSIGLSPTKRSNLFPVLFSEKKFQLTKSGKKLFFPQSFFYINDP